MPQLSFGNGQAIQFCVVCLSQFGYPNGYQLHRGIGAAQSVTVRDGMALCEGHWSSVDMIDKLKVAHLGD